MHLADYINEKTIFFLKKKHKREILETLIRKAHELGFIKDIDIFQKAIEQRETKLSTGIGCGIAIPHAKIDNLEDFFVLTALIKNPIDWDAMDQKPVSIVFLIGGPTDKQSEYLKLLSKIMVIVKNTDKKNALLSKDNNLDVALIFED